MQIHDKIRKSIQHYNSNSYNTTTRTVNLKKQFLGNSKKELEAVMTFSFFLFSNALKEHKNIIYDSHITQFVCHTTNVTQIKCHTIKCYATSKKGPIVLMMAWTIESGKLMSFI